MAGCLDARKCEGYVAIPRRLVDKLNSIYAGEAEKLDLAGSPVQIHRWKRRSTAAPMVITATFFFTRAALGLAILSKRN